MKRPVDAKLIGEVNGNYEVLTDSLGDQQFSIVVRVAGAAEPIAPRQREVERYYDGKEDQVVNRVEEHRPSPPQTAASVFSLPFIANRDTDVITAVVSSINAVLRNRWTMLKWGLMIATLTAVGFATAMFGFILIIPLLGYATWHGYRDALDVSDWPVLPGPV